MEAEVVAAAAQRGGTTGPQNTIFPANFTSSVAENSDDIYIDRTFKYNAPSDNPPTNLNLTGPDAELFEVFIEAYAADSNGDRNVRVIVQNSSTASVPFMRNFEFPQDANKDNVYEFSFSGTYQSRNIRSDVSITITDVLDQAESAGRFYVGNAGEEGFGSAFIAVPDITGDGKAELSFISRVISASDKGFIIPSENMEGGADIVLAADTANHIVEFVEPSPRPEANQSTTRNDVLSSRENADGSVDIVIGRGQLDNATVFHIPQSEREGGFTGDKTLGVATSMSYVLDFSDIERNYYARLIDDVNGDGKADIFLQSDGLPTKGIIFGDDSRLNSEITASFDIEIRQPIDFGTRNLEPLGFKKVPDLDSDGVDDFMIVRVSRITFLSGAALQDPTLSILDLEQLSSSQGFSIPIVPSSFRFADVISTSDFDGDGFPSLLFIARGAGGSGSGLSLVDGDDFIALASTPTGDAFG